MSVNLKPEARKELLDLMKRGWDSNIEIGANLCGREDELNLGVHCYGERCEVDIRDCGDEPLVGSVHTHPWSQPYLNGHDIIDSIKEHDRVACVCGNSKAPGFPEDLERPQPFEDLVCRCARLDADGENYEAIGRLAREYAPRIAEEVEETRALNRDFERDGVPVRFPEDVLYQESYRELRRKVAPRLLELTKKMEYEPLDLGDK